MIKVGIGFDSHRFVENRKLIIGGVEIDYELGLEGHSDADVLTHAVCDALLGALGEGDIGTHFPDSEPKYKNISSLKLLNSIAHKITENKFSIGNIDSVIVCEEPKLSQYIDEMKEKISKALTTSKENIGIKTTTNEKMGHLGRREGIAAYAIVFIKSI